MLRRRFSTFPRRAVCAAIAATFGTAVCAQPVGLTIVHGGATVTQQGSTTTIRTVNGAGTQHSVLDWQRFGVPLGAAVYFAQPDGGSTSINRVLGGNPSGIYGTLGSNGRLVLVNPAGIAVGASGIVDTAAFTASTLPMATADAIAGRMRFGTGDTTANPALLQVDGRVIAHRGDVVLLGPLVQTGAASIVQANGDVVLAAGRKAELTGRGLEGILLEVKAPDDQAVNLGTLRGDSVGIFASHLRHSGLIEASGATSEGGKVMLRGGSDAVVSGSIRAVTPTSGGSVQLTADVLVLKASASIDVSHLAGGGEILVGGGWQGHDARIANAQFVDVEEGVQLKADATLSGHGGTVVVWSNDTTAFGGTLSARGAGATGVGGQAEVSGKRQLVFRGKVDLGAANGRTGNLLLDPDDVKIVGGTGDGSDLPDLRTDQNADLLGAGGLLATLGTGTYTIYESELEGMNANISIQANKSIVASGTFTNNELLIAPDRNVKLEVVAGGSGSGIDLRATTLRTQGSGSVQLLTADGGETIQAGRIATAGGTISLTAANADITLNGPLDSAGGAISLAAPGSKVSFQGPQTFLGPVDITAKTMENNDVMTLQGATVATGGTDFHNMAGGTLQGVGTVDATGGGTTGKLQNDGTLSPGGAGAVGDLHVIGNIDLTAATQVNIDVASATSYDTLSATGSVKLDGAINFTPVGYAPQPGDSYAVVQSTGLSGSIKNFNAPAFTGFTGAKVGTNVVLAGPSPTTAPAPTPAPTTAPAPTPAPTTAPAPTPAPTTAPAPTPAPTTAPAPTPAPSTAPAPAPAPTTAPSPAPSPSASAGNGNGSANGNANGNGNGNANGNANGNNGHDKGKGHNAPVVASAAPAAMQPPIAMTDAYLQDTRQLTVSDGESDGEKLQRRRVVLAADGCVVR